jgi:hypothetical protein
VQRKSIAKELLMKNIPILVVLAFFIHGCASFDSPHIENEERVMTKVKYNPWGFKLNLMYAQVPPKYYRNLHNFNEFNAPRIDIGMLTASKGEQAIYGFGNSAFLPMIADRFYKKRRCQISKIITQTLLTVGALKSKEEIEFKDDDMQFIPPTKTVHIGKYSPCKKYVFFAIYTNGDSEGNTQIDGVPFLRIMIGSLRLAEGSSDLYNWDYEEVRVGRGDEAYQYKPFIFPPLYIAYQYDIYTDLDFDYNSPENLAIYKAHSQYYKAKEKLKEPYEKLVNRETISSPNEYGEYMVLWDGKPVNRSIVASQTYYDLDDDFQSAQVEAQLTLRVKELEHSVSNLNKELNNLRNK